jgi:hypothetical protein
MKRNTRRARLVSYLQCSQGCVQSRLNGTPTVGLSSRVLHVEFNVRKHGHYMFKRMLQCAEVRETSERPGLYQLDGIGVEIAGNESNFSLIIDSCNRETTNEQQCQIVEH